MDAATNRSRGRSPAAASGLAAESAQADAADDVVAADSNALDDDGLTIEERLELLRASLGEAVAAVVCGGREMDAKEWAGNTAADAGIGVQGISVAFSSRALCSCCLLASRRSGCEVRKLKSRWSGHPSLLYGGSGGDNSHDVEKRSKENNNKTKNMQKRFADLELAEQGDSEHAGAALCVHAVGQVFSRHRDGNCTNRSRMNSREEQVPSARQLLWWPRTSHARRHEIDKSAGPDAHVPALAQGHVDFVHDAQEATS